MIGCLSRWWAEDIRSHWKFKRNYEILSSCSKSSNQTPFLHTVSLPATLITFNSQLSSTTYIHSPLWCVCVYALSIAVCMLLLRSRKVSWDSVTKQCRRIFGIIVECTQKYTRVSIWSIISTLHVLSVEYLIKMKQFLSTLKESCYRETFNIQNWIIRNILK